MEFYHGEMMDCSECDNGSEHQAFHEGWHRGWSACNGTLMEELLLALRSNHSPDRGCRAHVLIDCIREADEDPVAAAGRALERLRLQENARLSAPSHLEPNCLPKPSAHLLAICTAATLRSLVCRLLALWPRPRRDPPPGVGPP